MTAWRAYSLAMAGTLCLGLYLFASAPPPLPDLDQTAQQGCLRPVGQLFDSVNAINQAARDVYTRDIVGPGLKSGLRFDEDWQQPAVEAGPLPALFLRLTSAKLEAMPIRLSLYLGSDAPINKSNLFDEVQLQQFRAIKDSREPVFATQDGFGQIAMYPDIAAAAPCVTCHNEHRDSPKVNWALNDVMGATTWVYPDEMVGADHYVAAVKATFQAVSLAYEDYLIKAAGFADPLQPGSDWPGAATGTQQAVLPDSETFMKRVRLTAGPALAPGLLPLTQAEDKCKP